MEFYKINNSSLTILPLFNSLIPKANISCLDTEPLPTYFHILCWDNGLINTFMDGSLYCLFYRKKAQRQIDCTNYSIEYLLLKIGAEICNSTENTIIYRLTLSMEWKPWIDAIKLNRFDLLPEKYILLTSINDPEVSTPTSNIGKYVVNFNLPWGIIERYKEYVETIKEDLNLQQHADIGKWPIQLYNQEKENYNNDNIYII